MKELVNAPRLLTFHKILADRKWHSTAEIEDRSRELAVKHPDTFRRVCAVNSTASDLRRKGYRVACRPKGRGVYEYRYEGRVAA